MYKFIFALLFSYNAMAYHFEFNNISVVPEFDINFTLNSDEHDKYYANLNCQSFIKKFDFFDKNDQLIFENYISIGECEYLYQQTMQCLDNDIPKCFDPSDLFKASCDC